MTARDVSVETFVGGILRRERRYFGVGWSGAADTSHLLGQTLKRPDHGSRAPFPLRARWLSIIFSNSACGMVTLKKTTLMRNTVVALTPASRRWLRFSMMPGVES